MAILKFWKMQAAGNDFVVLDSIGDDLPSELDFNAVAQLLCARGFGAGGDGLLLLEQATPVAQQEGATIRMRMWNPDGSEDMCGNGLRCIVRLAHERAYVEDAFIAQTIAGLRACEVLSTGEIRAAMGQPLFAKRDIPMRPSKHFGFNPDRFRHVPSEADTQVPDGQQGADWPGSSAIEYALQTTGASLGTFSSLSTGSTHSVTFLDKPLDEARFLEHSPIIENHEVFPDRTSVMWVQIVARDRIRLRIWERGVGETLACGTGACAAAVAAIVTGRCDANASIAVESRGGTLGVQWQPGREILLSGPAQIVYQGWYEW